MARPTKEEKKLKIKALGEAIDILIDKSTSLENKLTVKAVVAVANSSEYAEKFVTKINEQSLKKPSSEEFEEIADKIKKHKDDHRKIKQATSINLKDENIRLSERVSELTSDVATLLDEAAINKEAIDSEIESKERIRKEKDKYLKKLRSLGEY